MLLTSRRRAVAIAAAVTAVLGTASTAALAATTTTARPTTLTLTRAVRLVEGAPGAQKAHLAAVLRSAGKPVAAHKVVLRERKAGSTVWHVVAGTLMTSRTGGIVVDVPQTAMSEQYQLLAPAAGGYAASHTAVVTLTVRASTTLKLTAQRTTVTAAEKGRDTFAVVLASGKAPLARTKVVLQQRVGTATKWTTVATLVTDAKGLASTVVTVPVGGAEYRAVCAGDAKHKASVSATATVHRA